MGSSLIKTDQKKLPYTNAMIHVMQCVKYVLLVGGHRKCTKDVNLKSYLIPKVKNMFRLHSINPT
ncbi:hypothetical protein E2320_009247 [Naja naja]|nr:hypothetical protein E2320_009247 [Naja naja]